MIDAQQLAPRLREEILCISQDQERREYLWIQIRALSYNTLRLQGPQLAPVITFACRVQNFLRDLPLGHSLQFSSKLMLCRSSVRLYLRWHPSLPDLTDFLSRRNTRPHNTNHQPPLAAA